MTASVLDLNPTSRRAPSMSASAISKVVRITSCLFYLLMDRNNSRQQASTFRSGAGVGIAPG